MPDRSGPPALDPHPAFPAHLEADAVLRDGSRVHLRPVRPEDRLVLLELFEGLSLESRIFRFFSAGTDLERTAAALSRVDYASRYGLLASREEDGALIGHGTYIAAAPGEAEVAFAIADQAQGLGLATLMLCHLAAVAREHGIATFFAEVLPENHQMVEVFEDSGFEVTVTRRPDAVRFDFPTGPSPLALQHFAAAARMPVPSKPRSVVTPDGARSHQP